MIVSRVDLMQLIESSFNMAIVWAMVVGRKEGINGSKVEAHVDGKPPDSANKTLV